VGSTYPGYRAGLLQCAVLRSGGRAVPSADTVADGLNRYGYVAGNPTTATDPSGHCGESSGGGGNGSSSGSSGTGSTNSGTSTGDGSGDGGPNTYSGGGAHPSVATSASGRGGGGTTSTSPVTCDRGRITGARECYRWGKIDALNKEANWWDMFAIAAFVFSDIAKFVLHATKGRVWNAFLDSIDLAFQLSDLVGALGEIVGGAFQHWISEGIMWLHRLDARLMFVRGILSMPGVGAILQVALNKIMMFILPGLEGPFGWGGIYYRNDAWRRRSRSDQCRRALA
jgi:hypothetical protein